MLPRPLPASLSSLLLVAALGGVLLEEVACGNISLSNESGFAAGPVTSPHNPDASADAGGTAPLADGASSGGGGSQADAGTASVSSGNPLCFIDFGGGEAGAHNCVPDTSSQCAIPSSDVDSGVYDPSDDAGDGGVPATACHVIANGQTCTPAVSTGGDGAQCQSGTDCADSFECVGSPGQCRHYCCGGNATCDAVSAVTTGPTFCDVQTTTPGGLNVPICAPVTSCTPLLMGTGAGTCPKGETCAVVKDDGTTSCVAIGDVGIGGDCDVFHCASELTCLGAVGSRTCFQLCEVDSPTACPYGTTCTSSAQLFTNANVGICQ